MQNNKYYGITFKALLLGMTIFAFASCQVDTGVPKLHEIAVESTVVAENNTIEGNNTIDEICNSPQNWMVQYSNMDVSELSRLPIDLLVLDPDDLNKQDLDLLHLSRKKVIAYISIGEAEEYRSFWIDAMEFVMSEDPDWDENWIVDYSDPGWHTLLLEGYIPEIKDKGFDGLYLDTIESYHYPELCPSCTEENMIYLISRISEKYRDDDFLIIAQNGLEIGECMMPLVDGIAVESLYFSWIDGKQKESSVLEKEMQLKKYLGDGKIVLTVDYTRRRKNIEYVLNRSSNNGFLPVVTNKEVDMIGDYLLIR